MLYQIQQLPNEPIFVVRVKAPLHLGKYIYAIDEALLEMTAGLATAYRIDDLTRLRPDQFTLSDAREWFTGPIREDARWRSHIAHVVACKRGVRRLGRTLEARGATLEVPLYPSVAEAVAISRQALAQHASK